MIKHIVLFKMRDDIDVQEKASELAIIKTELENLMGRVPSLRSMEVGLNCNKAEKYELALVSTFDDLEGLEAYAVHPEHVAVGKKIRAMLDMRACTDYEI
jgi:hypothetical protein